MEVNVVHQVKMGNVDKFTDYYLVTTAISLHKMFSSTNWSTGVDHVTSKSRDNSNFNLLTMSTIRSSLARARHISIIIFTLSKVKEIHTDLEKL